MELKGKKVLVFGAGKSGIGAADLLNAVGACPVLYDGKADLDKESVLHKISGNYELPIYAGELPKEVQESLDLVVLSPGVPTDLPIVKGFYDQGLPVWGEVELAYQTGKGEVLAITGTNGKTTTTALLGKIMSDARPSVFVVGNIGTPYTSKSLEMTDETVTVAEISSFQLETIWKFAPRVSAILNITEDHLNRHHTMAEYIRVKELITSNQGPEDVCVLNYEDEILREFGKSIVPKAVYFSSAMNRPTLLIGGGYDKESSYDEWIQAFDGKVRYLVLIGQTKEKIKAAAEKNGFHDVILCEDLKEAVQVCADKANAGDAVLLSPACASWGQFDNYEQRGQMFKEYVRAL